VISWILDDLIQKGFDSIELVLREENHRLKQLLDKHYNRRIELKVISLQNPLSIVESLKGAMDCQQSIHEPIQVILGDTLIYSDYGKTLDMMYVSEVANTSNWCIAQTSDRGDLLALVDKLHIDGKEHKALCGYYCFSNAEALATSIQRSIEEGAKELSNVLMHYHRINPIQLIDTSLWYDFGHLESFIQSKKTLLRPRYFNSLVIDPLLNTITKHSLKDDKLLDELNWFKLLPDSLKVLTPRLFTDDSAATDKIIITQEFYGYPTLSELYVYGDLSETVWESILDYLFQIHNLFSNYKSDFSAAHCHEMYVTKTNHRIKLMLQQNSFWDELLQMESLEINGKIYPSLRLTMEALHDALHHLCQEGTFSILHGDFCLSNILYDLNNQIVRLIDPRGSFGEKGIYGDPRYDLAKLRHSITGSYDYIVSDLFSVNYLQGSFTYSLFHDAKDEALQLYLDALIVQQGYQLRDIKLIEGLLFLSMIPYHADLFERQQMMYIRATEILSELRD
jgi:NDP-sugar pyrophosphorylase family protein